MALPLANDGADPAPGARQLGNLRQIAPYNFSSIVIVNRKYAATAPTPDIEKTQFPGVRSAISGLRYYSPGTGRWLGRDSIVENGGVNIYAFIANMPIGAIDTDGRQGFLLQAPPLAPPATTTTGTFNTGFNYWGSANFGPTTGGLPLPPPVPLMGPQPKNYPYPDAAPAPSDNYQKEDPDYPFHAGKFDANWCNVEKTVKWAQRTPLTKKQALALLDQLESELSRGIQRDLSDSFERARSFVRGRSSSGITQVYIRSWPVRGTKSDRVDVEVILGRAFIDDGLRFLKPGRRPTLNPPNMI